MTTNISFDQTLDKELIESAAEKKKRIMEANLQKLYLIDNAAVADYARKRRELLLHMKETRRKYKEGTNITEKLKIQQIDATVEIGKTLLDIAAQQKQGKAIDEGTKQKLIQLTEEKDKAIKLLKLENGQMQAELKAHADKLEADKQKLEQAKNDISEIKEKLEDALEIQKELQQEADSNKQLYEEAKNELKNLQKDLAAETAELQKANSNAANLQKAVDALKKKFNAQKSNALQNKKLLESTTKELELKETLLRNEKAFVALLQQSKQDLETQLAEKESEIKNLNAKINEKDKEIEKLNGNINSLRNVIIEQNTTISRLNINLKTFETQVEEQTDAIQKLTIELTDTKKALAQSELQHIAFQATISKLQDEKQILTDNLANANKEKEKLVQDNNELLKNLDNEKAKASVLENEKKELESKLTTLEKDKAALKSEVKLIQNQLVQTENELKNAKTSILTLENLRDSLKVQISTQQALIDDQTKHISQIESDLQKEKDKNTELQAKFDKVENENKELLVQVDSLTKTVTEQTQLIEVQKGNIIDLGKQIDEQTIEIETLTKTLQNVQNEKTELENKNKTLQLANEDLTKQLQEKDILIKQLTLKIKELLQDLKTKEQQFLKDQRKKERALARQKSINAKLAARNITLLRQNANNMLELEKTTKTLATFQIQNALLEKDKADLQNELEANTLKLKRVEEYQAKAKELKQRYEAGKLLKESYSAQATKLQENYSDVVIVGYDVQLETVLLKEHIKKLEYEKVIKNRQLKNSYLLIEKYEYGIEKLKIENQENANEARDLADQLVQLKIENQENANEAKELAEQLVNERTYLRDSEVAKSSVWQSIVGKSKYSNVTQTTAVFNKLKSRAEKAAKNNNEIENTAVFNRTKLRAEQAAKFNNGFDKLYVDVGKLTSEANFLEATKNPNFDGVIAARSKSISELGKR
jgi:chromosome segregation ATPase